MYGKRGRRVYGTGTFTVKEAIGTSLTTSTIIR